MKFIKWLGIGSLTFAILVLLGKGVQQNGTTSASNDDNVINIATYNIDSKDSPDAEKMIEQLKSKNVEVAGFQEIDKNNDRNNFDMLAEFKGESYPFVHFSKGRDFANGEFGIGTISTMPFEELSTVPIDSSGGFATKTLERVVINKGKKKIAIYNTHLSFESTELRKRQFFQILQRVSADETPYKIILGDFNADSNIYEYSMFLNDFNLVNGNDGKWMNSFRLADSEMKVYTVDNIITTKNLEIIDSGMVDSDLSDHNMLFASLKILDKEKESSEKSNIALGQKLVASSAYEKANQAIAIPAMAVDGSEDTQWESAVNDPNNGKEEIIMELDGNYDISGMEFLWGENFPTNYSISASSDGNNYTSFEEVKNNQEVSNTNDKVVKNVRFIKVSLADKKVNDILEFRGYMLKEWKVFGTRKDNENAVMNEDNILSELNLKKDSVKIVSSKNIKPEFDSNKINIKNRGQETEKAQVAIQNIPVEEMKDYKFSVDNKYDGKDTNSLTFEVFPKDNEGNVIMSNYSTVTDIIKKDGKTNSYSYNIHTQSSVESLDIVFSIAGGENVGDIMLSNLKMTELEPINTLEIKLDDKPSVNTSAQAEVVSNTDNPGDFYWDSSDPAIISVDQKGKVTFNKKGSATLSAVMISDSKYTVEKNFTVK